jgi:hypothetical protein
LGQIKLEATLRELLENGGESHQSGARCISPPFALTVLAFLQQS